MIYFEWTTDVPDFMQLVQFANNLAVIAVARTLVALAEIVNPTFEAMDACTTRHRLHSAHQKTEAIILSH